MRRLGAVVMLALAGFIAAIVVFNTPAKKGCPLDADKDPSYSGTFEGPVSMDETKHVLRVSQGGRPLSGAQVCVNTEMVGMSGMGYSAEGNEINPGRYGVGFQFGMPGQYRGNVVAEKGGKEVSIPFVLDVTSTSARSGGRSP